MNTNKKQEYICTKVLRSLINIMMVMVIQIAWLHIMHSIPDTQFYVIPLNTPFDTANLTKQYTLDIMHSMSDIFNSMEFHLIPHLKRLT